MFQKNMKMNSYFQILFIIRLSIKHLEAEAK